MEKVEFKTEEEKKVCDWIRNRREYFRKNIIRKNIYIIFDNELNRDISAALHINVHKKTGNIVLAHGLQYMGKQIHPTTNKRLRCTNKHAIEEYNKGFGAIQDSLVFMESVDTNIHLIERIDFVGDKFIIRSEFQGRRDKKLKFINELIK